MNWLERSWYGRRNYTRFLSPHEQEELRRLMGMLTRSEGQHVSELLFKWKIGCPVSGCDGCYRPADLPWCDGICVKCKKGVEVKTTTNWNRHTQIIDGYVWRSLHGGSMREFARLKRGRATPWLLVLDSTNMQMYFIERYLVYKRDNSTKSEIRFRY